MHLQAAAADVLLSELLSPVVLACPPGTVPAFHTLPLSRQTELLLLLRAAPHRFSQPRAAALLQGLQLPGGLLGSRLGISPLLHILAHDVQPSFSPSPGAISLRCVKVSLVPCMQLQGSHHPCRCDGPENTLAAQHSGLGRGLSHTLQFSQRSDWENTVETFAVSTETAGSTSRRPRQAALFAACSGTLEEPPLPPCPDFLFSASPAFPWTPKLLEPGAPLPLPLSLSTAQTLQGAGAANPAAPLPGRTAAPVPQRQEQPDGRKRAALGGTGAAAAAAQGGDGVAASEPAKRQRVALGSSSEDEDEGDEDMLGDLEVEGTAKAAPAGMAAAAPAAAAPQQGSGAPPAANEALDSAAAALKRALTGTAAGGAAEPSLGPEARQALGVVLGAAAAAAGPAGPAAVLTQAGLASLADDNALLLLVREAVGPATTFACSSVVAGALMLPRLQALVAPPSRALAAAVEHMGEWL